jgi:site-specific recombinase XerD
MPSKKSNSKFRAILISPRKDFGSFKAAVDQAGLPELSEIKPRLYALPLLAVIVDRKGNPNWLPTLFLADTAMGSRTVTGDTVRTYSEALIPWLSYLAERHIRYQGVTEETIGVYRAELVHGGAELSQRRYASSTINLRMAVASAFHQWGQRRGMMPSPLGKYLCTADPTAPWHGAGNRRNSQSTRLPKLATPRVIRRLPVALSEDEIKQLVRITPMPYRLMLKWSLTCGLRRFEVCSLQLEDIPSPETIAYANDGLVALTLVRKGSRDVTVYVTARLVEETGWYIMTERANPQVGSESFVFLNSKGRPISRQMLTRTCKERANEIGSKATLHHLRHTYAVHVLNILERHAHAGEEINSLKTLQVMLGHARVETTEIYLQAYQISGGAAIAALDFLYGAAL